MFSGMKVTKDITLRAQTVKLQNSSVGHHLRKAVQFTILGMLMVPVISEIRDLFTFDTNKFPVHAVADKNQKWKMDITE